MRWNAYDFVLSADAQFNGASADYVPDLHAYSCADLASEYQTIVSPELRRLLPQAGRSFESADQNTCVRVRSIDDRISFPAEFFQCHLQRPGHYVDFRGRHVDVMNAVRSHHREANDVLDAAFRTYYEKGIHIDSTIYAEVDRRFGWADDELRGILKGYLTQKPRRAIFMIDVESSPASFPWLEPVYQTIRWHLSNLGLDHAISVSGKGYHFLSQIPLHTGDYGLPDGEGRRLNYAMLNVMARGGRVHPETIDRMVTTRWGSRKVAPTPLLSQRAYQGMWKLVQWLAVNIVDDVRGWLAKNRMAPWVNFTDSEDDTVILDLTSMLRQAEMAVFGSVGSLYNKSRTPPRVRLLRSRNGHEYFGNDLNWMMHTRTDLGAAKMHFVHAGGRIPDGTRGIENMVRAYDSSRIKRDLHDPCDRPLDPAWLYEIYRSNYRALWRRCPQVLHDVEKAQPNFLNPKALKWVYGQMARSRFSVRDMMALTKAVYCDPMKRVDIDPKYSKDEWARWPMLLMGEWFKG